MMRKLFILLLLVGCSPSEARMGIATAMSGAGAAALCDVCSGADLSLAVHFEDDSGHAVGTGSPCGCSDADAVYSLNSDAAESAVQKSDGTKSLYIPTTYDYAYFALVSEDIVDDAAGTITFDLRVKDTWADSVRVFDAVVDPPDGNNQIYCITYDGDELRCVVEGDNSAVTVTTSGALLAVNTWYSVTLKWRAGETDPAVYLAVGADTEESNTNLTPMADIPDLLRLGNSTAIGMEFYLDNVKVYKTWQ